MENNLENPNSAQKTLEESSTQNNTSFGQKRNSSSTRGRGFYGKRGGNKYVPKKSFVYKEKEESNPKNLEESKDALPSKEKNEVKKHPRPKGKDKKTQKDRPDSFPKIKNVSDLALSITQRLERDQYECMICTNAIKKKITIWHCTNCYSIFHLYCIKKWSKASIENVGASSWICPGCQFVYINKPVPTCFCGKTTDPPFNPYHTPHSCGEICGKKRSGNCPHKCTSLCHPGHCPPCSALTNDYSCFCGREFKKLRCGEKKKSCGRECGKLLGCGKHYCKDVCHEGECSLCSFLETQTCYCGKFTGPKKCGSGKLDSSSGESRYFSCGDICTKPLFCGKHNCDRICHEGPCGTCKTLPSLVTTCPCGKIPLPILTPIKRTSCTELIATCPNTCDKLLPCGIHCCTQNCHNGPCSSCHSQVKQSCQCGATQKSVECFTINYPNSKKESLICKKKCKAMRICGRHACGRICCPSSPLVDPEGNDINGFHICNQICNRKLKCGNHHCDLLCHSGSCPPCHIASHEEYVCECGKTKMEPPILCGTKPPKCNFPCIRSQPCGHECNHNCHDRNEACPPCTEQVEKMCMGGHEMKKVKCFQKEINCGKKCGKSLPCGIHVCQKFCHSGDCLPIEVTRLSKSCGQVCGKRRNFCSHTCKAPCHPDQPCPSIPCQHFVKLFCSCKRRSVEVECGRGAEYDNGGTEFRELSCDEECEKILRNKKLAEAFGKVTSSHYRYSDFLLQLAKSHPLFIVKVEKKLEELMKNPISKIEFPSMDRIQRLIIHELVKHYQMESQSFGKEPFRNVVVTKTKESRIPPILLSKAIKEGENHLELTSRTNSILHVYNLDSSIKTEDLKPYFHLYEGQYDIKWLDECNALVIFHDPNQKMAALSYLENTLKIKEYNPQIEQPTRKMTPLHTLEDGWFLEKSRKKSTWANQDNTKDKANSNNSVSSPQTEKKHEGFGSSNPFNLIDHENNKEKEDLGLNKDQSQDQDFLTNKNNLQNSNDLVEDWETLL